MRVPFVMQYGISVEEQTSCLERPPRMSDARAFVGVVGEVAQPALRQAALRIIESRRFITVSRAGSAA
jgi:hypothetical protein